jgi:hypothetical protein
MNSSVLVLVFAITNFQRYLFAPSRKSLLLPQNAYSPTLLQQDARSRTRMLAIYFRTSGVIPQNSNDSDIAFLPANDFITFSDFYTNPSNLNKTKNQNLLPLAAAHYDYEASNP